MTQLPLDPFVKDIKVRFSAEDHAQVVYFPRFFDYFHQVFEDFFDERGPTYRRMIAEERIGWPVVRAVADFHRPVSFGDTLRVALLRNKVGTRSARFIYRGTRLSDMRLCVTGDITVACISLEGFTAKEIPASHRALFDTLPFDAVSAVARDEVCRSEMPEAGSK